MVSRCADSILINGRGRVTCRDPEYLTNIVPTPLTSVLQHMNYTAKGYVREKMLCSEMLMLNGN